VEISWACSSRIEIWEGGLWGYGNPVLLPRLNPDSINNQNLEGSMKHVLITVSGGIIDRVTFYDDPSTAGRELARFVRKMDPEKDDAVVYGPDGLIANAKVLMDSIRWSFVRVMDECSRKSFCSKICLCNGGQYWLRDLSHGKEHIPGSSAI
jgi:hypothetical protein